MNYIISKENFDKCEICAYHESGHIVFAYLCGYSCLEVQLINKLTPEGFSSYAMIDYGKDSFIASKLIGLNMDPTFFKSFSLPEKLETIEIGQRLSRIYMGGSVATAIFLNNGNPNIPLPIQLDYTDLFRVENIKNITNELSKNSEEDVIENSLKDVVYSFHSIHIWNAVNELAKKLLDSNHLEKGDIEESLMPYGIISNKEDLFMQLSN